MKSWHVLSIGLIIGLVAGLVYTWVLSPPEYYNTYPPLMHESYRKDWIQMTALAFGADGNLKRAQLRLYGLDQTEVRQGIAQTLDVAIANGRPLILLQRLADLAQYYGATHPAIPIYTENTTATPMPATKPPTITPTATAMPPTATTTADPTPTLTLPSPTPTPEPATPFQVISQTLRCMDSPLIGVSLILSQTVEVRGRERIEQAPQPGREIWLIWEQGADRAITGFRTEFGLGYADFIIEPGYVYKLYVDMPTGVPISTLQVAPCTPDEGGGWIARTLIVLENRPASP